MLFQEAIDLLKTGECLYRTGWEPQDGYIVFMKGMSHVWKIVLSPTPNAGNYIFSVEDFSANDWSKFELPKAPVEVQVADVAA
jgi:hypothetical protein